MRRVSRRELESSDIEGNIPVSENSDQQDGTRVGPDTCNPA